MHQGCPILSQAAPLLSAKLAQHSRCMVAVGPDVQGFPDPLRYEGHVRAPVIVGQSTTLASVCALVPRQWRVFSEQVALLFEGGWR